MELNTLGNGRMIGFTVLDSFGMPMGICLKANSNKKKLKGLAFIFTRTEPGMKDIGRMIYKMGRVQSTSKREETMKDNTRKE